MPTTSEYLQQLQTDKQNLVNNLVEKGVSATSDETFTSLVPKVLDIQTGNVEINDCSYLFYRNTRLNYLNEILSICKNPTNCNNMFSISTNLTNLDLSGFDTSNVTNMMDMFSSCSNLTTLNIKNFNTSKVTTFNRMFTNDSKLKDLDLSSFDTSNATNMAYMLSFTGINNIDLSSFNTSKITSNSQMFYSCTSLEKIIINRQDVFKMTNINMLSSTPIEDGTGFVYVPDDMVETYKSATNWSTYASQIKPISELPEEA